MQSFELDATYAESSSGGGADLVRDILSQVQDIQLRTSLPDSALVVSAICARSLSHPPRPAHADARSPRKRLPDRGCATDMARITKFGMQLHPSNWRLVMLSCVLLYEKMHSDGKVKPLPCGENK